MVEKSVDFHVLLLLYAAQDVLPCPLLVAVFLGLHLKCLSSAAGIVFMRSYFTGDGCLGDPHIGEDYLAESFVK